jgi:GNAT superfamily N-acetyltransferase
MSAVKERGSATGLDREAVFSRFMNSKGILMGTIQFFEREMTAAEFARMNAGFDEHTIEHGNPIQSFDRYGFVAVAGEDFIGCASGLAYKNGTAYSGWFYLTDLFIEKPCRGQGLGASILRRLEDRVAALGVRSIWTWTAGYEALEFYKRQGYRVFCELEDWYATGDSKVGLRKSLRSSLSD